MRDDLSFWKQQFRSLAGWSVRYEDSDLYAGQFSIGTHSRTAAVYPWGNGARPSDYFLHEILHICIRAIVAERTQKERREAEELFVQDLCRLISGADEGKKP